VDSLIRGLLSDANWALFVQAHPLDRSQNQEYLTAAGSLLERSHKEFNLPGTTNEFNRMAAYCLELLESQFKRARRAIPKGAGWHELIYSRMSPTAPH